MLVYPGSAALSDFRQTKLLRRLRQVAGSITGVSAEYLHFVDADHPLSKAANAALGQLLCYGRPLTKAPLGELFLVVPRLGTISPWSSKATDIARNCGLRITRIERGIAYYLTGSSRLYRDKLATVLHDRMTEAVLGEIDAAEQLFVKAAPKPLLEIDVITGGVEALQQANTELGLALAADEIEYLLAAYRELGRNPTDAELMMFALVNSEHCRHKIFNADWLVDGQKQPKSLFRMIKNTYQQGGQDVLSAYSDNAAVLSGRTAGRFFADPSDNTYRYHLEPIHSVIKVETHNHPTAIAPTAGAATGSGGEIRDEAATGRGAKTKMGLAGYSVSNLRIPEAVRPWEKSYGKPERLASALDIMLEAPIGAAGYVNEFGRPNLAGYFRSYEQEVRGDTRGYHKPIMIAGGVGNIRAQHVQKHILPVGAKIIVLGGPAMLIGLGGGSASSTQSGSSQQDLDFASVQRANAELERRAQEVIDHCWALGDENPIISIHDVGAGGLSNALPELARDSGRGARFDLRSIPSAEPGLSPMEIWCNEAQERYVLGIRAEDLSAFEAICLRERCPYAVVGETIQEERLILRDDLFDNLVIDLPLEVLFGKPPKMTLSVRRGATALPALRTESIKLEEAVLRVLQLPAVGSKKFLITIGDRTVGGLIVRDQMVGPWQVPVADVAVAATSFTSDFGEAMTIGERPPLALIDGPASGRMAVGEALTNIAAADVAKLSDIKLSANWMAAAGVGNEDEKLFDTVKALGQDFCPALGLTIPVGKDSLSMRAVWEQQAKAKSVTGPLSVIISAFSTVENVQKTLTPQLRLDVKTELILIDLGGGKQRLGGSALAQVYNQLGDQSPDADPAILKNFFAKLTGLKQSGTILAYHDRSDGGLLATLLEMAFASRCGLDIKLDALPGTTLERLFNEELGVVVQVKKTDTAKLSRLFRGAAYVIGSPVDQQTIRIASHRDVYRNTRAQLEQAWSDTSYQLQKLRDNPAAAEQEFAAILDDEDPGLSLTAKFTITNKKFANKPKVAIFREVGVNGQVEMAAAFERAGFISVDVHLNDIIAGRVALDSFVGLAACGGFSYGDVLGAGEGWAKSILFNPAVRQQFKNFFERPATFSLGVCNGCQMLAALKALIPGAELWPSFQKNTSEQFEARLVMTEVNDSPSIFFRGMAGSQLPIPVAHGEGRTRFDEKQITETDRSNLVAMRYVDNYLRPTETYPFNPNGSPQGITALTTPDGRATILMPHPERAFLNRQLSWHPASHNQDSPWMQIFYNARAWVG